MGRITEKEIEDTIEGLCRVKNTTKLNSFNTKRIDDAIDLINDLRNDNYSKQEVIEGATVMVSLLQNKIK